MALISKPYTFTAGGTIVASEHNSNYDTIYNEFNGSISNANISGTAAITDSKLAQISTAGKVSGAALTTLGSIPSGGGVVPVANLGSGTPSSSTFLRGDGAWTATSSLITAANALAGSQVQQVITSDAAYASLGSTAIPRDNSKPQNTEGNAISALDTAITPNATTNKLKITLILALSNQGAETSTAVALFQDTTADALIAWEMPTADSSLNTCTFVHTMDAGTTSATTFKVRVGTNGAATVHKNGTSTAAARIYGGASICQMIVEEIKV